jgi:hypothetical protein
LFSIWDQKLSDKSRLSAIFDNLTKRGEKEARLLYSAAVYPELTLQWVLMHRSRVMQAVLQASKDQHYVLDIVKHSIVILDKARDFYIAAWPERIMLMNIAKILAEETNHLISDSVYSFRAGRGPTSALSDLSAFLLKKTRGGARRFYVLKRDVTKYGDTIPHDKLIAFLLKHTAAGDNPIFMNLLKQSLRCYFKSVDGSEKCMIRGVPSGSPLVPPLENLYLTPLDNALRSKPDSFYGRYGDDFLFVTTDIDLANKIKAEIETIITGMGLAIKPEKKQDILLTLETSPQVPYVESFQTLPAFEWLGARIDSAGRRSMRRKHQNELWLHLKFEIKELLETANRLAPPGETRLKILRAGLLKLISKNDPNLSSALIFGHTDPNNLKQFDHLFIHFLVSALERHWSLGRKMAWKTVKGLRLPTTFFQQYLKKKMRNRSKQTGKDFAPRAA